MIAIFYDVENLQERKNYYNAINLINDTYNMQECIQFAYAEWSRFEERDRVLFIKHGINLKQVINGVGYFANIKNVADISLSVDIMELLFKNKDIEKFVIVSGDGGYISLVNKLKEYGKTVDIVSVKKYLNQSLRAYCDNIYFIDEYSPKDTLPPQQQEVDMYKRSIWAILKNYDDPEIIIKNFFRNKYIKQKISEDKGIYYPSLLKSFALAKNLHFSSPELKEFKRLFRRAVARRKNITMIDNFITPAIEKEQVEEQAEEKTLSSNDIIEIFKEKEIYLSKTSITDELLREIVSLKDVYLQLSEKDAIRLLKEKTKRSMKLATGAIKIVNLLGIGLLEKITIDNYQSIISSSLSKFSQRSLKHFVKKKEINRFFGWTKEKEEADGI